jgi:hypothetical protein
METGKCTLTLSTCRSEVILTTECAHSPLRLVGRGSSWQWKVHTYLLDLPSGVILIISMRSMEARRLALESGDPGTCCTTGTPLKNKAVLGIRDILVRIRIRIPGSVPLTSGSNSGFDSFLSDFKDAKKIFFSSYYFFITCLQAHHLQSKKFNFLLKFCLKMLFCRHYFSPLNTFMRKVKGPDPYLWLMDPDPGGPKACGSGSGSGSPSLEKRLRTVLWSQSRGAKITNCGSGFGSFLFTTELKEILKKKIMVPEEVFVNCYHKILILLLKSKKIIFKVLWRNSLNMYIIYFGVFQYRYLIKTIRSWGRS